jgi:DNA-binding Lrp family transcriptional regulator
MNDIRFSIIPAGAVLDPKLEARDLQVLCLFGRHIDRKGWCRRSQVQMAKEIGCARSTVQASIDRLIEAGWLQRRAANDLHTPGVRDSAHEYRVVLDVADDPQDVVSTPADQSAPLPTQERHPLPTHGSAPMLTTPSNVKKEARTRSGPTEGPDVVGRKVSLHCDDPIFRKIVELRGNKHPPTTRDGYWSFPVDVVDEARNAVVREIAMLETADEGTAH